MRPKSFILLALALGCGLIASIGISQVMDRQSTPQVSLETAPIYVALHGINLGDPIDGSMVALQEWPKDKIPPGAISQLEDLEGRRPRTAIVEGEPLMEAKLLAPGQVADPITNIPKGYRLKTVSVDAEASAAGLLSPGDRVDLQLFVKKDSRLGITSSRTKVILQNIRVFAVDQAVNRTSEGDDSRTIAKTISLLLTPEQASKVTLAENLGSISLIPRNPDDDETAVSTELTFEDIWESGKSSREKEQVRDAPKQAGKGGLFEAIRRAIPKPQPKPPFRMEIVEAHDVREMIFDGVTGKPIRERESTAGPEGESAAFSGEAAFTLPTDGELSEGTTGDEEGFPIEFVEDE